MRTRPSCTSGRAGRSWQVDNLHPKALSLLTSSLSQSAPPPSTQIIELHGTLAKVHCLKHRHNQSRDSYQEEIAKLNPMWQAEAEEAERTGNRPRTNPDGDVRAARS